MKYRFNRCVSYICKGDTYAFYSNYRLIFFKGASASLMKKLINISVNTKIKRF